MPPHTRTKRRLRFSQPKKHSTPVGGSWAKSKILSPQSAITSQDIQSFLITAISGWNTNYSDDEKRRIIDALPPAYRVCEYDEAGALKCPIGIEFIMGDPYLKRGISKFKEEVGEGSYEDRWQQQAKKAMAERADGMFDEYLQQHTEEMFGDVPEDDNDAESRLGDDAGEVSSDGSWPAKKNGERPSHEDGSIMNRPRGRPRRTQLRLETREEDEFDGGE